MDGLPTELIYILIFAAVLLYQYAMRRFERQRQQETAQNEPAREIPEPEMEAPAAFSVSRASVDRFGRAEAPRASTAIARRRFSRAALMGNRRDVQNAIVIATILGPCRAYEPHKV